MAIQNAVNGAKSSSARVFLQRATSPAEAALYYGCLMLEEGEKPLGEVEPIRCPSSTVRGKWDIVDEVVAPEENGTVSATQRMDRYLRDAWWDIFRANCPFNLYVPIGLCGKPDDFTQWDGMMIYYQSRATQYTTPRFNPLEGDDAAMDLAMELSFRDILPVRSIKFGEVADTIVLAEALDGIYNDAINCGSCGPLSDGLQKMYVLTLANSGSPGLSSQIAYSLNGAGSWSTLDIPTLAGLSGNRIASVGNRLVVISQAGNNHHHILFDDVDNGLTSGWAVVSSGYVSTKGPRAIYSKNSAQTFVAGAGGYIYLMSDPTLAVTVLSDGSVTTQDFNDISGFGQVVIAVGNSNAIALSQNGGESFSAQTGPEVGVALNAVAVQSPNIWFIGTANGKLYYTTNAGRTYTQISLAAGITTINDIQFVNDLIGYMAVQVGGSSRIYRTIDGGNKWHNASPFLSGLPTAERYNFVAPGDINAVLAGGRVSAGGDGIVAHAA